MQSSRSTPNTQSSSIIRAAASQQALGVSGNATYTDAEKKVLEHTSRINHHIFVPFMSVDLQERFVLPVPFTDRDGLLALAPKQRADFAGWRRISELHPEPQLIANSSGAAGCGVSFYSIKQTVVSDCSVVASLAVAALYERRHGRRLITSIIWPRNRRDEPIYNESGKYSVRLHVNGVPRKVIIDDQLPVGRQGQLLCSYSSNRGEFWVSLLEKAYMKLMGGYDFPGSNSVSIRKNEIKNLEKCLNADETVLFRLHRISICTPSLAGFRNEFRSAAMNPILMLTQYLSACAWVSPKVVA